MPSCFSNIDNQTNEDPNLEILILNLETRLTFFLVPSTFLFKLCWRRFHDFGWTHEGCTQCFGNEGCFLLQLLNQLDLRQTPLEMTIWKSIKIYDCEVYISLGEKKFVCLKRIWISIFFLDKLSSFKQTLGARIQKICYHVSIWGVFSIDCCH